MGEIKRKWEKLTIKSIQTSFDQYSNDAQLLCAPHCEFHLSLKQVFIAYKTINNFKQWRLHLQKFMYFQMANRQSEMKILKRIYTNTHTHTQREKILSHLFSLFLHCWCGQMTAVGNFCCCCSLVDHNFSNWLQCQTEDFIVTKLLKVCRMTHKKKAHTH